MERWSEAGPLLRDYQEVRRARGDDPSADCRRALDSGRDRTTSQGVPAHVEGRPLTIFSQGCICTGGARRAGDGEGSTLDRVREQAKR